MDRLSHDWRPERDLKPPNTAVERVLDALIRTVELGEEPPYDLEHAELGVLTEALTGLLKSMFDFGCSIHSTGRTVPNEAPGRADEPGE